MHLISVDLPAPLSPTRAMTSPDATWKSTSYNAWTAPKAFETPCSSRTGVSLTPSPPPPQDASRGATAPRERHSSSDACRAAGSRDLTGADLLLGGEVDLADVVLHVVLGDGHRGEQHRRDVLLPVVDLGGRRGRGLALEQGDRELGRRVGLLLGRLVDGHAD